MVAEGCFETFPILSEVWRILSGVKITASLVTRLF